MMYSLLVRIFSIPPWNILLIALPLAISAFASKAENKTIHFGIDSWPPFTIVETGNISGIDIEVVRVMADTLALELKFVPCPFKRCLRMMENGELDMLGSLQKTRDRQLYMHYIEPSYYAANKVFYTLKANPSTIEQYQDLQQYTIGVTLGHKNNPRFDQDTKISKFAAVNTAQLSGLLMKKRIDAFLSVDVYSDYYLLQNSLSQYIKKSPFYFEGTLGYFALSKTSGLTKHLKEFNRILENMKKNGEIDRIIKKVLSKHSLTKEPLP
ncbi:transporter substrate-binding domain-containing protein [Thalassomonas sp. RHCl1]|uniref:substrate-binding periplasmic protein n=1 Tax=Thalassomonas sp. RHCl1 TaxID=2995320 RepID=UPI00248B58E0|nr:transporter substrate-binding domain-containing protein [Thalassomonas sp. RHCl1]